MEYLGTEGEMLFPKQFYCYIIGNSLILWNIHTNPQ